MTDAIHAEIAQLNDTLRVAGIGGHKLIAGSLAAAPAEERQAVTDAVRGFTDFNADNDPHSEHDFGVVVVKGKSYIWKIDYYNLAEDGASPDATDPMVTVRMLSIFYAEDY